MDQATSVRFIDDSEPEPGNGGGNNLAETGSPEPQRTDEPIDEPVRLGGIPQLSPIDIGTGTGYSEPRTDYPKRRGRKPGTRNRTPEERAADGRTQAQTSLHLIDNIEEVLVSIHFMGAKLMEIPELELSTEDARKFTKAVRNVASHYNVSVDPKKMALFQLATAVAGVYGPRAIAIYNRKKTVVPKKEPAKIVPIDQVKPAPPKPEAVRTIDLSQTSPSQLWSEAPNSEPFSM